MERLLILSSTFPATTDDGVPAFVLDIAREVSSGFEVTVLTPRVPGSVPHEIVDGIEVVRFPYFFRRWEGLADGAILDNLRANRRRWLEVPFFLLAQLGAVRRLTRSRHYAAIHAHWIIPQGVTARLAAPRIPTLITAHGADVYALRSWPWSALKRWVLRGAASVTTVNADMAEQLRSWGVEPGRVSVVPMGVTLSAARPARRGSDRIVAVGRLVEKKGFSVLLDALRTGRGTRRWSTTIVGDGPLHDELEAAADGLDVEFPGQLAHDRVIEQLAGADIVALPSVTAASGDQEGLPVVLLEAMAQGRAIVASELPGIRDALTDGESALLVPPGDAAALAGALERLTSDAELRARLGAGARSRASAYSIDTIGDRYRQLLESIAETSPEPAGNRAA